MIDQNHRPLIRLLVRLMGIFFIIDGFGGVIINSLDTYFRLKGNDFNLYPWYVIAGTSVAWLVGSIFLLMAGLYLTFRGQAATDAIFHESLHTDKVLCPECGYDLKNLKHLNNPKHCPECGQLIQ